ncbi:hypothetical protein SAMN05192569_10388 [Parageobacillus thermantarcticus]|uniref:Uncharacterized protein n=1 Tax=Parageobacillus thermantarcticus TaxID=186116 RepID=A0A1I0TMG6_9BACL|nr:hypothetical protein [Parageobacillus thermantarcticus]SFA52733.1 hypothetical protein SAMN05192569_10388 [Parageobacillus thermantarcticus]
MFKLFKFKTKGVKKSKDVYQSYKESHQSERDSEPVGIIVNRWSGKLKKKYGI